MSTECKTRKMLLDGCSVPMLIEKSHPQIAHAHSCNFWRMGKKHGPCTCGAVDATNRLLNYLATISPRLAQCECGHRGTDHFGGMTKDKTPTACNRMGCLCTAFKAVVIAEKDRP